MNLKIILRMATVAHNNHLLNIKTQECTNIIYMVYNNILTEANIKNR